MQNTEKIKTYLKRLGAGEKIESVREDFVREFREVDPAEIMQAEQKLLKEGTPLEEVQRLCDVHAALFHGTTTEERIANAEKSVAEAMKEKRMTATAELTKIPGHPLHTFTLENDALEEILKKCREAAKAGQVDASLLEELRQLAIH